MNLYDILFGDIIRVILFPLSIVSVILWFVISGEKKRLRKLENSMPSVLREIADKVKSGISIETSIKEIGETRKDLIGREFKLIVEDTKQYSLTDSLHRFANRNKSKIISRIVSVITLAILTSAEIGDVLRKISDDLWSIYMLDMEREMKTKSSAMLILLSSVVVTPGIAGLILAMFGQSIVEVTRKMLITNVSYFILCFIVYAAIMYGIILNRMKQSVALIPIFMYTGYTVYHLVILMMG